MKTWILLAATSGAAVLLYDSISRQARLFRKIPPPESRKETSSESFAEYLAEAMEVACGAGTSAKLAVFADPEMLAAIVRHLSRETRSVLVRAFKVPSLAKEALSPNFPEDSWVATRVMRLAETLPNGK